MSVHPTELSPSGSRTTGLVVLAVVLVWGWAVAGLAEKGVFLAMPMPAIAILVAAGIAAPTFAYLASRRVQSWIGAAGLRPLTVLHVWRVPAAVVFLGYGLAGDLPPLFWMLAGGGDLIAGLYAARFIFGNAQLHEYWRFHQFGFADFVVAVGTGLAFTLMEDPRMATIAGLPMALIPLFGVGISGASHLIAFDQIRKARRAGEA